MENFPVSIDMYTAVVGLLLPLLISTIVSPDWAKQTKGWISFGLVSLAAAGHLFFIGDFDIASFPGTLLKVLFLATGSYLSFWRPTGIKDMVEKNIGTKAKNGGLYDEQGFAKLTFVFLLAGLMLIFNVGMACAAYLAWEASTGADGYIVYYTDKTNNYNYNVGNQTTCEMDLLNLAFGVEYSFHVTAYNATDESGPSNTVVWTNEAYVPPVDVLPPTVIEISGPVTITIGN